jgi:hypothetical protein
MRVLLLICFEGLLARSTLWGADWMISDCPREFCEWLALLNHFEYLGSLDLIYDAAQQGGK